MTLTEQKAALCKLLQTAMELEWSTIPPYLTALLSIKPHANRVAANVLRSVMMEEMLHMVLVGNLISSLGGTVRIGKDNRPSYPLKLKFEGTPFKDRNFDIDLAPFSAKTIATFLKIEMPASLVERRILKFALDELEIPNLTIGDFYQRIIGDLEALCEQSSEAEVFTGDPAKQIGEQYYWSGAGKPVIITSLATAKQAVEVVMVQGEGAEGSIGAGDAFAEPIDSIAHYFRFNEIALGRFYLPTDKPRDPPSGDPIAVDYSQVFPIKTNPRQSDYAEGTKLASLNLSFNQQYSLMLTQLETAFHGTVPILFDAILNGMRALTPIALEMMATPIENDPEGKTGAPSFEWVSPPTI